MHTELPGFYSDAEKNRDFPSSSKKEGKSQHPPDARSPAARPHTSEAAAPSPSPSSSTSLPQMHRRSTTDSWHALQQLRIATSPRQRIATTQCVSKMMTAQLEASAAYQAIPFPVFAADQTLKAFAAGTYNGRPWTVAGDDYNILYTFDPSSLEDLLSMTGDVLQHSWARRYHLGSERSSITSIRSSGPRWVATTFDLTILVHDVSSTRTMKVSLPSDFGFGVSASHLRDRSLVLGVGAHAVLVQDIENMTAARSLETGNRVFALHQEESLVFTGDHCGTMRRFDTRTHARGEVLLREAFTPCAITYLNIFRDWQLLVSTIAGAIQIFDVRFLPEARPLQALVGNERTFLHNLPHTITPSQDYLFVAGDDRRIRGWSLLTGEPLTHPHPILEVTSYPAHPVDIDVSPFGVQFDQRITSLEVIEAEHELCLFATSGSALHRFILGRRFPFET